MKMKLTFGLFCGVVLMLTSGFGADEVLFKIVTGREEADKTRTLAKIPITATSVRLRLLVTGNQIRGQYRPAGSEKWLDAGAGELPTPPDGKAKISLHCYQGPPDAEHWARFSEFQVRRISK